MATKKAAPWYAGEHQDALFYLLIAIFFIELIVGGISFFYGIIHARPEAAGGPPVARFPWLAWVIASVLAPVALLLVVHLAGTWLSRMLTREEAQSGGEAAPVDDAHVPEGMKRFYASVRHAPTIVLLCGILLIGAGLFFVDGAISALGRIGVALMPHIPWIAGSLAALLAICFLAHALMVYRQRKMENEYAWRREVLEKTGLVLVDKSAIALPRDIAQQALIAPDEPQALPPVIEIEALPGSSDEQHDQDKKDATQSTPNK